MTHRFYLIFFPNVSIYLGMWGQILKSILLIGATLSSFTAYSMTIEGWICKTVQQQLCVQDHTKKITILAARDFNIHNDLQKLTPGDYVIANGNFSKDDSTKSQFFVRNLDSVGLKKILGLWQSEKGILYNFLDFNKLSILFSPNSYEFKYHYNISPGTGPHWTIFITSKAGIIGRLTFETESNKLNIHFYNSQDASIESNLTLTPVSE